MGEPLYLKLQENVTSSSEQRKIGNFQSFKNSFFISWYFLLLHHQLRKKEKKEATTRMITQHFSQRNKQSQLGVVLFFQRLVEWSVCLSPAAAAPAATVFRIFEMICLKCSLTKLRCTKSLHRSLQRQHALKGSFRFPAAYKRWNCFVVAAKSEQKFSLIPRGKA